VTQQHNDGVSIETIMITTRHKSYDMVRKYIAQVDMLKQIGKQP